MRPYGDLSIRCFLVVLKLPPFQSFSMQFFRGFRHKNAAVGGLSVLRGGSEAQIPAGDLLKAFPSLPPKNYMRIEFGGV